jgi:hypothetical protein
VTYFLAHNRYDKTFSFTRCWVVARTSHFIYQSHELLVRDTLRFEIRVRCCSLEAGWTSRPVWTMWRTWQFLNLSGFELEPLGRPARSQLLQHSQCSNCATAAFPLLQRPPNYVSRLAISPVIQNITIPQPLLLTIAYNRQNAFTFTLQLLEGRTAVAWEPST